MRRQKGRIRALHGQAGLACFSGRNIKPKGVDALARAIGVRTHVCGAFLRREHTGKSRHKHEELQRPFVTRAQTKKGRSALASCKIPDRPLKGLLDLRRPRMSCDRLDSQAEGFRPWSF